MVLKVITEVEERLISPIDVLSLLFLFCKKLKLDLGKYSHGLKIGFGSTLKGLKIGFGSHPRG